MTEPEGWQVSGNAAEVYEKCFVPAIFGQWAPCVADAARLTSRIVCSMSAVGRGCWPARLQTASQPQARSRAWTATTVWSP